MTDPPGLMRNQLPGRGWESNPARLPLPLGEREDLHLCICGELSRSHLSYSFNPAVGERRVFPTRQAGAL